MSVALKSGKWPDARPFCGRRQLYRAPLPAGAGIMTICIRPLHSPERSAAKALCSAHARRRSGKYARRTGQDIGTRWTRLRTEVLPRQ